MRRKDRERPAEFAFKVCDSCSFATIAMIDSNNLPYCVPLNIVREDNVIYFHCAKQGLKNESLNLKGDVCISCVSSCEVLQEKFTTLYESAIIRGVATVVTSQDEVRKALRLLCERHTPDVMDMFEKELSRSISGTEIYKVVITQITGKSNV